MKKIVIASVLACAGVVATATELDVTVGRDYAGSNTNAVGIALTQPVNEKTSVTVGLERRDPGNVTQTRLGATVNYDVAKIGTATVVAKAGVAYLDNKVASNGWASTVGVGVEVPVTNTVSATVDYRYQSAFQSRVEQFDGSAVFAGLKYKF